MSHPAAIDLEAFACGEDADDTRAHVDACEACRAYVGRARGAKPTIDAGPTLAFAKRAERRRSVYAVAAVFAPLAIAAAVFFVVRARSNDDGGPGTRARASAPGPTATVADSAAAMETALAMAAPSVEPDTTFKGGVQIAVVRERGAAQARFTGDFRVEPGDRVRVEVALDRSQAILGAVLGDDGSWLELMPAEVRDAGTYFSENSVRVDASPMSGTIVVGPPEAVRLVEKTHDVAGARVRAIRVTWEPASTDPERP